MGIKKNIMKLIQDTVLNLQYIDERMKRYMLIDWKIILFVII